MSQATSLLGGFQAASAAAQQSATSANLPGFLSVSSLASQAISGTGGLGSALIPSSNLASQSGSAERLAQILPRSAKALEVGVSGLTNVPTDLSDRGTIASMSLVGNTDISTYNLGGTKDELESAFAELQPNYTPGFTNFFLTTADFDYQEKMQISQTFGDNEVVYYFGQQPVFLTLAGILFDSLGYSWFTQFISLYNGVIRGSKLAAQRALIRLNLPNMTVVGTFASLHTEQTSTYDSMVTFNARFLVKSIQPVPISASYSGLFNYSPSSSSTNILNWSVGRDGLGGSSFSSLLCNGIGSVVSNSFLDAGLGAVLGGAAPSSSYFNSLTEFGKGVFSPIFSILSSVTNIVQATFGNLESLVSNFTTPIKNILGVVQSVLGTASSIAKTIENDFAATVGMVTSTVNDVYSTLQIARNTVGIISQVPETMSQSLQVLSDTVTRGPNAYNLFLGGGASAGKAPFLSSGAKYNPVAPYSL